MTGKFTSYTANTTPAVGDILLMVDDPSGSPLSQKITLQDLLKVINGLTADATPDPSADYTLTYDASASTPKKVLLSLLYGTAIPGGRLTLTSGTPVTSADVTASTNVYYTPYIHNKIMLWDGSYWNWYTFTEQTLALGTVTASLPYDVFGYLSSGVLAIEKLAWTNGTTRATGISLQDGRYCKTGDKTRLYLGTFYTTSTTQTADSSANRYLFNMYNRQLRYMSCVDTTDSWNYSTSSWRAANSNTTNGTGRVAFVVGLDDTMIESNSYATASNSTATARAVGSSIGYDTTTASSAQLHPSQNCTSTVAANLYSTYKGQPSVGVHYLQRVEYGAGTDTQTWYGDAGGSILQTGLMASIAV